jgi:hypothetical protein
VELIAFFQDLFAAAFNDGVKFGCELGHAIA